MDTFPPATSTPTPAPADPRVDPADPVENVVAPGSPGSITPVFPADSVPPVFVSPFGWRVRADEVVGPNLPASTAISPTHAVHRLTGELGETDIVNIKPPSDDFQGMLILITPDDRGYYFAATGNIKRGFTVGPGRAVILVFSEGFWYAVAS